MEEKALTKELMRLRRETAPSEGPLVSIVVTNRNGETHLRRLFDGLSKRTAYEPIEVVLVDNGSVDESLQVFESWTGRKQLVANSRNMSFSVANNQGVRAASGELVLLANNDIDPINPDWLGFMVQSLDETVAAAGAMLVYPRRPARNHPPAHADLTIQHLGISFEYSKWGVRAVNEGLGRDPLSIISPRPREVPAVTAACLLARREDLIAHPFDENYWYGSEDWDLCLRLGNTGKVVVDERAVLFHHEYGTQDRYMDEEWMTRRVGNHQHFNALWGPALMRRLRAELTSSEASRFFRVDQPPTVTFVANSNGFESRSPSKIAEKLGREARNAGWTVVHEESQASDLAIAITPPKDVAWFSALDMSLAVVIDQEKKWSRSGNLDAATKVVVPDHLAQARLDTSWGAGVAEITPAIDRDDGSEFKELLSSMSPRPKNMRIGVSTCAPDWDKAQFWGDTHLARGLMRAFRRMGHEVSELIMSDWCGISASSCDVIIHLRGLTRRPVGRGQWNLLWIISHPDRIEAGEFDDYDLIASASQRHADRLTAEIGRTVHFLPQATDADAFKIGPTNVRYETPVLYVGNARWPNRRAPRWMMRNHRSFHLYGKNWEDFPESRFVRDQYIPNRELAEAYRSAAVVVADHHGSMRTEGFVANRLFDVLASGGLVLSDDVAGLDEVFGDLIPTYSDARELESQLRVLLADRSLRRHIAADGRQIVESRHTLDHRARRWLELLDQL